MPLRQMMSRSAAGCVLMGGLLAAVSAAWGQDEATRAQPPATETEQDHGVSTVSGVVVPDLQSLRPGREPLLREGSHLVEVAGHMAKDATTGQWRFHVSRENSDAPGHVLTMLPSTILGEMVVIVDSSPQARVVFEATGEVFVYRGRNYFLPTHPPRLLRHEDSERAPAPAPEDVSDAGRNADQAEGTADAAGTGEGDSVEDIMRRLDEAVGEIAPPSAPAAFTDGAESTDRSRTSMTGGGGARQENLLREGTVVLSRRGRLRRDSGGAWVFVFDADATGLADPPLTLLPCLLLERMENYVRRAGDNAPTLLSGHVYVYEGRNYLMPTVYRIPRERANLSPQD
ncbi:MAG: hypothetical protein JSV91_01360 [Phycisphaerales bacterium]|nr:MAG: hypothetical protein JSV91_01360 [Phycisphaerales bacterium]